MSSTKIDVTQIDLPGNPNELLAGDGSAVTVGSGLTLAGGVVTNTNPTPAPLATAGTPGLVELGGGLGGPGSTAFSPVLDLAAPHVSGVVPSVNLPAASAGSFGVVELGGGLGGAGSVASAPVLNVNSGNVSGTLPAINQAPQTLGGDLSGTTASATVTALQNQPVTGGAVAGQYLRFNGAAYTPTTVLYGSSSELAAADGSTVLVGANLTLAGGVLSGPSTNLRAVLFVTTDGNDGTADGSINLPFASLQGAHDYATANFDPSAHVVVAIAPGEYRGALNVTRSRTHFSAIGVITPTDRTVKLKDAAVVVDLRGADSVVNEVVSFEGIVVEGSADIRQPTVYITGTGLFRTVFNACDVTANSSETLNYAIYCDNTPDVHGQSVIELQDCRVSSTVPDITSTTIYAKHGAWSIVDSLVSNQSVQAAAAIYADEESDSVVSVKGSTIESRGASTIAFSGTVIYPTVKITLDSTTVKNLAEGDNVTQHNAFLLDKSQYLTATNCTFFVADNTKAGFLANGPSPSYLGFGGEQYTPGSNRLTEKTITRIRLDAFTGQYLFVDTDYDVLLSDYVIDCDGTFKVTLPPPATITGRMFVVKNSGGGTIIAQSSGGEDIDGSPSYTLGSLDVIMVMSTGNNWIVI